MNTHKYRVFVSYSHDDLPLVEPMVKAIEQVADVMWDKTFSYGHGFHRQIELYIAHSHAFVPVITAKSNQRGWVHQEIGFAMARNIPVLPIAVGPDALPGEMIQSLQAIRVPTACAEQCEKIVSEQFTETVLENLVADYEDSEQGLYQCAEETEDRARLLVCYCRDVRRLNRYGMVRQAGGLTSFHIPSEPLDHPVWQMRAGVLPRSRHHCKWQRLERRALEAHARREGCRLVIDPTITYAKLGPDTRRVRLHWLLHFLKAKESVDNVQIVTDPELNVEKSTTIVGDWFVADAVSAALGKGFRHTIFTRHAPSARAMRDEFDEGFRSLLRKKGWTLQNCLANTICELEALLRSLGGPVPGCDPVSLMDDGIAGAPVA